MKLSDLSVRAVHRLDSKTLRPNTEPADDAEVARQRAVMAHKYRVAKATGKVSPRNKQTDERRERILFHMKFRGSECIGTDLMQELDLSRNTVNRDLEYLRKHDKVTYRRGTVHCGPKSWIYGSKT